MKYKKITTAVCVVPESVTDGYMFSELATYIELIDEGGGPFVKLSQAECGEIRLQRDELEPVMQAAMELLDAAE